MTTVSEGKSRDVPSRRSTGGGKRERRVKRLSPLIPRFHVAPYPTFIRDETSDGPAARRMRGGVPQKKKSRALLPAHERTKETIVEYEVEYKLSSGDRARNQSTSCPASAPLPFRSFPAYRLLYSKLYQTSRDVRMRSLCSGTKKLRRI